MTKNQFENRLAEIRNRFVLALQTRGAAIQKAIETIETGQDDKSALTAVRNELHKITGTAAPLGFVELGERARRFEDRIELYLNYTDENQCEILTGLKNLQQEMLSIRQNTI